MDSLCDLETSIILHKIGFNWRCRHGFNVINGYKTFRSKNASVKKYHSLFKRTPIKYIRRPYKTVATKWLMYKINNGDLDIAIIDKNLISLIK